MTHRYLSWILLSALGLGYGASAHALFSDSFEGTPPVVSLTQPQAAAFLQRATFGPKMSEIQRLGQIGLDAWIDEQLALPMTDVSSALETIDAQRRAACIANPSSCDFDDPDETHLYADDRHAVWWQAAITAPDQLRHRVAFALSQILVVSEQGDPLAEFPDAVALYYDILLRHAFGSYRDLLEEVTLSPAMGVFLSHVRNRAAVPELNIRPDENFAREVMQLFTIGLVQLNEDGSPILDSQGRTIPTYGQNEIKEMARIFTGWNFATGCDEFTNPDPDLNLWEPMEPCPTYHDSGAKQIVNGVQVPAGLTPAQDIDAALDALFNHPNIGPFIARRLIQSLVTSNPSPAYIARVARVFANNGQGQRGNLGAVVRAILTDPEALEGTARVAHFGKLREPILRLSALWRSFGARSARGDYYAQWGEYVDGQTPLGAPSVFNFFLPDYQPQGLAGQGLRGPEFQLASDDVLTSNANILFYQALFFIAGAPWVSDPDLAEDFQPGTVLLRLEPEMALLGQPNALLDRLDLLLTAGSMSPALRSILLTRLNAIQQDGEYSPHEQVGELIAHILSSPEFLIQR